MITLFSINAYAFTNCPSDKSLIWHDCFGTYNLTNAENNGDKYVGQWAGGQFHGQGTYIWASGEQYIGEFKEDIKHGKGIYTWVNGEEYVGEFKEGKRHGQGTNTYPDGSKDIGFYMNDKYVPNICRSMELRKGDLEFEQCILNLIDEIKQKN